MVTWGMSSVLKTRREESLRQERKSLGLDSSKPPLIRDLNCYDCPPSPPLTRGGGKERLTGQRGTWTCLERVLWGKSNLHWSDIIEIRNGGSILSPGKQQEAIRIT